MFRNVRPFRKWVGGKENVRHTIFIDAQFTLLFGVPLLRNAQVRILVFPG